MIALFKTIFLAY